MRSSIKSSTNITYDYSESLTIKDMGGKRIELQYIYKSPSYDKRTFRMLKTFLKTSQRKGKPAHIRQLRQHLLLQQDV